MEEEFIVPLNDSSYTISAAYQNIRLGKMAHVDIIVNDYNINKVLLVEDFNYKEVNWETFKVGGSEMAWGEIFKADYGKLNDAMGD